ncbi:MAG: AAA family ATPase, partial [Candidatus Thorarchaeota archaeon]|nr:AAA family ATPase [Candidatus Thorarchaeota archaeon]
ETMKDVVVIAATNRPELLDKALIRTGRFDRFVNVDAPDKKSRKAIFEIYTADMPLADDVDINKLVDATEYYVGGDIEAICREAGMRAMREEHEEGKKVETVTAKHFEEALKEGHASTTKESLDRYRKLDQILRRATEADPATASMYG